MNNGSFKNYFMRSVLRNNVLTFGNFILSSKETSDHYYDFNSFNDGKSLNELGFSFYKTAIEEFRSANRFAQPFDVIYGCAYKGIQIAISISSYAWGFESQSFSWTFNRKEIKDHGDLSVLVGNTDLKGKKILLVDDVFTTGNALKNNLALLSSFSPKEVMILVGINRTNDKELKIVHDEKEYSVRYIATDEEILKYKKHIESLDMENKT